MKNKLKPYLEKGGVCKMVRGTIIRTAILIIALLNQLLVSFGSNPISGNENDWYMR